MLLASNDIISLTKNTIQRNPKPQVHSGEAYSIDTYLWLYNQITGKKSNAHSLDALIDLALEEWKENINE